MLHKPLAFPVAVGLLGTSLVAIASVCLTGCPEDCTISKTCEEHARACDPDPIDPRTGQCIRDASAEVGVDVPADCDLAKSPKDSAACIDDGVGVFVSANGDDAATGSKTAPVKTIVKGVEVAASRGVSRVYICEGTYDAAVEIKSAVSLYGGLTCGWEYTGAKPKIAPATGIALRVTNVSTPVIIQDVEVVGAADSNKPGDSAIAAFVSESTNVTFRSAVLRGGSGTPGAMGAGRVNYSGVTATKGANGSGGTAGTASPCTCTDGTSSTGGAGASGAGSGIQNGAAVPAVGTANSGLSGATTCTDGQPGANGLAGGPGAASSSAGALSSAGWTNVPFMTNGPNGDPAQGGGGGGAKTDVASAGGGGGCGGCGGAGGASGTNGGSSFALLSFNSNVSIEGGSLMTNTAGGGGDGGDGQAGQGGGGSGTGPACNGGPGGNGAGGSGGGGGAGGHSVPVAFVGAEPRVTSASLAPGTKGAGGGGGSPGAGPGNPGTAGAPGPEGKAQNILQL